MLCGQQHHSKWRLWRGTVAKLMMNMYIQALLKMGITLHSMCLWYHFFCSESHAKHLLVILVIVPLPHSGRGFGDVSKFHSQFFKKAIVFRTFFLEKRTFYVRLDIFHYFWLRINSLDYILAIYGIGSIICVHPRNLWKPYWLKLSEIFNISTILH